MKHYIIIITTLLALASCDVRRKDKIADEAGEKQEKIEKEKKEKTQALLKDSTTVQLIDSAYNFGTIASGERVQYSFRFKNTGDKPLVIEEAHASCGCTVPEKPEKPIMPGETSVIKVVFDSKGKSGHIEKNITVKANAKPSFGELKIFGEVNKQ